MAEYTHRIDENISQLLSQRGRVTPDMIAGIDDAEAAELLRTYVEIHNREVPLIFDGQEMTWAPAAPVAGAPELLSAPSPVDQVLAEGAGPSLLDTAPAGQKVSAWLWALPLSIGLPGGAIAWFVAKDANKPVARALFAVGVLVTVVSIAMGVAAVPLLRTAVSTVNLQSQSSGWPASASGRPAFYYFGDPG